MNPGQSLPLPAFNTRSPSGGPKVLPLRLDFTSSQSIAIDLGQQETLGKIGFIQSAYIDNSLNTATLTLTGSLLGQKIVIPAGAQMWTPLLMPNPPQLQAVSTGNVIVPVFLTNVPLPFGINPSAGGILQVQDAALEALITNIGGHGNGLAVNVLTQPAGSAVTPSLLLNYTTQTFFNNGATALTGLAITGPITVTGWDLSLDGGSAIAGGASTSNVGFFIGSASADTCLDTYVTVPAVAPATPIGRIIIAQAQGLNIQGSAGSPGISGFWGGGSLTSGAFRLNVYGHL